MTDLDEALHNRAQFAAKLAKAQADMPAVSKDKKHQQGYAFQSADSIFAICRPLLARHGLAYLPTVEALDKTTGQSKSGSMWERSAVRMAFVLIDTDTGYSETVTFFGEATDYNNMDVPKSLTNATKLFLKALFLVSEQGDDPDEDDRATPPTTPAPPSALMTEPLAQTPQNPDALLNAVNRCVTVPYDNAAHLFNAIRAESGNDRWNWPAKGNAEGWKAASQWAIQHANKKQRQPADAA